MPSKPDVDFLCLQIYANSDTALDQGIKYIIKNELVEYLTPCLKASKDKTEAIKTVNNNTANMANLCKKILKENNLKYDVQIKLKNVHLNEQENLKAGAYDSIVVELGRAEGKTEDCVIYPPLKINANKNVKFKSKIQNWVKSIFK